MLRSASNALTLALFCSLAGSSSVHDPCIEIKEGFDGSYNGVAIALSDGNAWFALPLSEGGRCTVRLNGDYALYEKIRVAWEAAEYGDEYLRAVDVNLTGRIESIEIKDPFPGGNTNSLWLQISGAGRVSSDVTAAAADQKFKLVFGMTLEARRQRIEEIKNKAETN